MSIVVATITNLIWVERESSQRMISYVAATTLHQWLCQVCRHGGQFWELSLRSSTATSVIHCNFPLFKATHIRFFVLVCVCVDFCASLDQCVRHTRAQHRLIWAPGWDRTASNLLSLHDAIFSVLMALKWIWRLQNCLDSFKFIWTVLKWVGGFIGLLPRKTGGVSTPPRIWVLMCQWCVPGLPLKKWPGNGLAKVTIVRCVPC